MAWTDVASLEALDAKRKLVVRHDGRQILLLATQDGIVACANRCPHEGYPLSEGTLAGCVLTCNWHNWQFDLASGETLVGGDLLPRYPVEVMDGRIRLDLTPPDPAERHRAILQSVRAALDDQDEQRLVRETARLMRLGFDPLDAVRTAIDWAAERLEFGTTHAVAAASGWLMLWRQIQLRPKGWPRWARSSAISPTMRGAAGIFRFRGRRAVGTRPRSWPRSSVRTRRRRSACCAARSRPGWHPPHSSPRSSRPRLRTTPISAIR